MGSRQGAPRPGRRAHGLHGLHALAGTFAAASIAAATIAVGVASTAPTVSAAPEYAVESVVPLAPARVLETRNGPSDRTRDGRYQGIGRRAADSTTSVRVRRRAGVVADADAVVVNVTAIRPDADGFLTVFPCDAQRPNASTVNFRAGEVVANAAISRIGGGGSICVYTSSAADVAIDVNGFVPHGGDLTTIVPARFLETRPSLTTIDGVGQGIGKRAAGSVTELTVAGRGEVPPDATSVALNLTAVAPEAAGYLTMFPCGSERPNASNVNYLPGQTVPNAVLAKVGAGGAVCIFTSAAVHVVVDVVGFVGGGVAASTLLPARLLETRSGPDARTVDGLGLGGGRPFYGSVVTVQVAGRGDVPQGAAFALLNVTAVRPDDAGYLTVFPCDGNRPLASNVNYLRGDVRANAVVAKLSAVGTVCIFTVAPTDIVVDVNGYGAFTPSPVEQVRRALTDGTATTRGELVYGVFVCAVPIPSDVFADPARLAITPEQLANDANTYVRPYFDSLSGGRYTPRFVPASVIALDHTDDARECMAKAETAGEAYDLAIGFDDAADSPDNTVGLTRISTQAGFSWPTSMWISGRSTAAGDWSTLAHEMGHALFWRHAQSNDGFPYGDHWDVMGWAHDCNYTTGGLDPAGQLAPECAAGQHTQAMNRFASGWIPDDRVTVHASGTTTASLGPLGSTAAQLVLATASGRPTEALSIEARVAVGHDVTIPAEGVLVRHSDGMLRRAAAAAPATSCNFYPPACDRILGPGESLTVGGVTVTVTARTGDVFDVSVSGSYTGFDLGSTARVSHFIAQAR